MALDIINDPNDPNNKNNQQGASQAPAAGQAPSQPGSASNTAGSGSPNQSTGQRTGSGFVNLQNVISANQNNQLGSTINSGIKSAANNVQSGVNSAQQDFQNQYNQNNLASDSNKQERQSVLDRISNYQAGTDNVNTVGQGPNASSSSTPSYAGQNIANSQEQQDFGKFLSGQYTGPTGLQNYDQLNSQAQEAQQLGQNVNSSGGRQALLQQFISPGSGYSTGEQTLDNLILGQTGANDLLDARKSVVGLGDQVQNAQNLARQQGLAATSQAKQFGQDTRDLITKMQQPILDSSQKALSDAQAKETQNQANYKKILDLLTTPDSPSGSGGNSTQPINHSQEALTELQNEGLLNADQSTQLNSLISQGYIDPKSAANAMYEQALKDPNSAWNWNINANLNPSFNPAYRNLDNSDFMQNKYLPALQAAQQSGNPITNQQAIDAGFISPTYSSLNDMGVDPQTALRSVLTNTQAQGLTQGAFLNPTQQAQLNALSTLTGEGQNPLTVNTPTYQAGSNTFDVNNLMGQINSAETRLQSRDLPFAIPDTTLRMSKGGIVPHKDGSMPRLKAMFKKK